MRTIDYIFCFILIIGGLNWGLVGLFDFNLLNCIFSTLLLQRIVYAIVGIAALGWIFSLRSLKKRCSK